MMAKTVKATTTRYGSGQNWHTEKKKKSVQWNFNQCNTPELGTENVCLGRWRSSWWFICASCLPASPEEMHLRHVEVDVLIPKLMREKAKERCVEKVEGVFVCATILSFVCTFFCMWKFLFIPVGENTWFEPHTNLIAHYWFQNEVKAGNKTPITSHILNCMQWKPTQWQ